MDISYSYALTDAAFLNRLGTFIKHHRLDQNKTQKQLAEEAGVNRTTLVELEKGKNANLLTFIQLLRALKQLQVMEQFVAEPLISPLLLAEMQHSMRKRAGKTKLSAVKATKKPSSTW